MKETKKQRKLRKGMNAATLQAYSAGHKTPVFHETGGREKIRISAGVPFVNAANFGM